MEIDRFSNPERVPVFLEIEMGNLSGGMNAGIGAPGGLGADRFGGKLLDGLFDRLLDGWVRGLALPAHKVRSVIFDGEFIARHELCAFGTPLIRPPRRSGHLLPRGEKGSRRSTGYSPLSPRGRGVGSEGAAISVHDKTDFPARSPAPRKKDA